MCTLKTNEFDSRTFRIRLSYLMRLLGLLLRFYSNISKLWPLVFYVGVLCNIISVVEYLFPATRLKRIIPPFVMDFFVGDLGFATDSIVTELGAVLYSAFEEGYVSCDSISVLYAAITALMSVQVSVFDHRPWTFLAILILLFVIANGLTILTSYRRNMYVGHILMYAGFAGCFVILYIAVPLWQVLFSSSK